MSSDGASRVKPCRKKASFHLPTETNPNPKDNGNRYSLNDEINVAISQVEDKWGGSSFEGFYTNGVGSYRMKKGELSGAVVVDLYRRFFVVFNDDTFDSDVATLKGILEEFRGNTGKNGAPIQESIYLEIETVEVHFVGDDDSRQP